jgi:seryl-tRNA synthetase
VLDLRWLREHPADFDAALVRRGLAPLAERVLALDAERRRVETELQQQQAERNALSRRIGELKARGEPAEGVMGQVAALKDSIRLGEDRRAELARQVDELLAACPNRLADDVPDGPDATANVEIHRWGDPLPATGRPHDEVGAPLGMDFERAARMSGARFVTLWGGLARLHRALATFMLDVHTREHGYTEVAVPYLVRDAAVYGTGQLPKAAADMFRTDTGHWLIPTAEVALTNLVREEILDESHLPLRLTAWTPCFRSEAGAAGKDTRGMIRQHQFDKVELVAITTPEQSDDEHERLTRCAETILERLDLPYRRVLLCAGDTGFGARRTYDLEVWLPGQGGYREISSCSTCGDFQARRMSARYRPKDAKGTRFVHTLNGSGLAVGRTLIAVLENGQQADGSVRVPKALRAYLGGLDRLVPAHG